MCHYEKVKLLADLAGNALVCVLSVALEIHGVVEARRAQDRAVATREVRTIDYRRRARAAVVTLANNRGVVAKGNGHTLVEYVQRTFPQPFVAVGLAVSHDSTLDLIDLGETAVEHRRAEDFAPHTAGAVGHDGPAFEVVVFAAVQLGDEVLAGSHIGNDGVCEPSDSCFECVSSVEKHHVVPALGNEVIHLSRAEVNPAVQNARGSDDDFIGRVEPDELGSNFDAESWEVVSRSVRPLHVCLPKSGILLGGLRVAFDGVNRPADGSVDAVRRHNDPPTEPVLFAQRPLPEHDGMRVGDRRKRVEQDDFIEDHVVQPRVQK